MLSLGVFTFANPEVGHQFALEAIRDLATKARGDIPNFNVPSNVASYELKRAAEDPRVNHIIISSEVFSVADPSLVRERLAELSLTDLTMIFFFRRQDRVIESGYGQVVRYNRWTAPVGKPRYVKDFDWYLLASTWAHAIGREKVKIHLYDAIDGGDLSIIDKLMESIDTSISDFRRKRGASEEKANMSFPAALIEFNRLANCAGATNVMPLLERASQLGFGGSPFRMSREAAKAFLDIYRESNRRLAREFLQHESDLFDESDLEVDSQGADYTNALPIETLAMLFALHVHEQVEDSKRQNDLLSHLTERIKALLD